VAGVEPTLPEKVEEAAARFTGVLGGLTTGVDVYIMPAGRELAASETPVQALKKSQDVVLAIQKELRDKSSPIRVVDLSGCYAEGGALQACTATLPGRRVRLVGYPGFYSAADPAASDLAKAQHDQQKEWVAKFEKAMGVPVEGATTILVAPLTAQLGTRPWGSDDERTRWMALAGRAQAALGIAGDPALRRAAYDADATVKEEGFKGRWLLTPSLAASPGAGGRLADGASVISVAPDGTVSRDMFWYSPQAAAFRGQIALAPKADRVRRLSPKWLWGLGKELPELSKAAVFFIALLAAFLTVVAVWQIPAPTSKALTDAGAPADAQKAPSILVGNFARTVLSGLGGLAAATLALDTIGQADKSIVQHYYLVWFIVWFLFWLFGSSIMKAVNEGLRVTSYVGRQPETKRDNAARFRWTWVRAKWLLMTSVDAFFSLIQGRNELKSTLWANEIRNFQEDTLIAIDAIALHLRAAIVDHLNQSPEASSGNAKPEEKPEEKPEAGGEAKDGVSPAGKGQAGDAATDGVPPPAPPVVPPVDHPVEPPVDRPVESPVEVPAKPAAPPHPAVVPGVQIGPAPKTVGLSDVRVAVSVLSNDAKRVYYVSWPPESSSKEFDTNSMAYIAVAASEVRWWARGYEKDQSIILFDNSTGVLSELGEVGKKKLLLKDYFQNRGSDYSSFIVIPIPLRPASGGRRAGLHISFKTKPEHGVSRIWPAAVLANPPAGTYDEARNLLETTPPDLERLLLQSINVIESLLRSFNEEVFEQALKTRRRV
jgi:hypothetical protein